MKSKPKSTSKMANTSLVTLSRLNIVHKQSILFIFGFSEFGCKQRVVLRMHDGMSTVCMLLIIITSHKHRQAKFAFSIAPHSLSFYFFIFVNIFHLFLKKNALYLSLKRNFRSRCVLECECVIDTSHRIKSMQTQNKSC